ncbi:Zinc finger and SCAN domain-containing protein 29 [Chelonia mydas]|uniref:Zinc finger and SCAN domain-containing protein 29 n=1 Tax=Chelonia mydas TaxID=8469 RepID=M7BYQ2_CHEMY|nr:Zinc finger and SCAN domain-containing protein 29 [Chelonia mydas]
MLSRNRKQAPAWTERETLDLIAVWGEESVQAELRSKRRNANIFAKISQGMVDRGYPRDIQQYHVKVKELRQAYQKIKEANGSSGSEPHTCRFYEQLHGILGGDPTTIPPLSVDTCKGGVSRCTEENFVDEEEEEDEEEENAQRASGESVLPGGQDLFITLEPIPSQGGIPDPEAPLCRKIIVKSLSSEHFTNIMGHILIPTIPTPQVNGLHAKEVIGFGEFKFLPQGYRAASVYLLGSGKRPTPPAYREDPQDLETK